MPIGCSSFLPVLAVELAKLRPANVLDLGIGMGMYGAIVRQYLDSGVRPWKTRLVGVEGFAEYRNPCWDLYDEVFESAIEEFVAENDERENVERENVERENNERWDAILLLDVLEHFERPAGEKLLLSLRRRLSDHGKLYVGTPAIWMEQGAVYGNEFERHRSLWTAEDFARLGCELLMDGTLDRYGNTLDRYGNRMLLGVAGRAD